MEPATGIVRGPAQGEGEVLDPVETVAVERKPLGAVVQIDDGRIQAHLDEVVRSTVEETLNALLDAAGRRRVGSAEPVDFGALARDWYREGANWIGGCCRTGPEHIRRIHEALVEAEL